MFSEPYILITSEINGSQFSAETKALA